MQKVDEVKNPPMMTVEGFGTGETSRNIPESVVFGHYPEFEEVELPDNLKSRWTQMEWQPPK